MILKWTTFALILVLITILEGRVVLKNRNRREIAAYALLFVSGSLYCGLLLLDLNLPSLIDVFEAVFQPLYLPLSEWVRGGKA